MKGRSKGYRGLVRFSIAALLLTLFTSIGWTQDPFLYEAGFEVSEGFTDPGPFVFGVNPDINADWTVLEGVAAIVDVTQMTSIAEGRSLEVNPLSVVDTNRAGSGAESEVWLQGSYRTVPQDTAPDLEGLGLDPSSALMYFDSTDGIMVYNGLTSAWEPIGVQVDPVGDTWYLVTIRLDFSVPRTWDIYVDNVLEATGIGFKDPDLVTGYSGFRCRSGDQGSGYLDNFYVGQAPPINIATPTPTPTQTPTPTPTPEPEPEFNGTEFFLYSVNWDPEGLNETPFSLLNLEDGDSVIDWLDVYEYMKGWRERP